VPFRRRSPGWVREMSDTEVHAIAWRFMHERQEADLSRAQEWLFDACISELEHRRRTAPHVLQRCSCELCFDWSTVDLGTEAPPLGGND